MKPEPTNTSAIMDVLESVERHLDETLEEGQTLAEWATTPEEILAVDAIKATLANILKILEVGECPAE